MKQKIKIPDYIISKEQARNFAIEWQHDFENHNYSYSELAEWGNVFEKLGRKFGLVREFKENGIL